MFGSFFLTVVGVNGVFLNSDPNSGLDDCRQFFQNVDSHIFLNMMTQYPALYGNHVLNCRKDVSPRSGGQVETYWFYIWNKSGEFDYRNSDSAERTRTYLRGELEYPNGLTNPPTSSSLDYVAVDEPLQGRNIGSYLTLLWAIFTESTGVSTILLDDESDLSESEIKNSLRDENREQNEHEMEAEFHNQYSQNIYIKLGFRPTSTHEGYNMVGDTKNIIGYPMVAYYPPQNIVTERSGWHKLMAAIGRKVADFS